MGAEYYRFWVEHHIECKIRFRHVMHFRTGGDFFGGGGFKPTCRTSCSRAVSHLVDMNCFVIYRGWGRGWGGHMTWESWAAGSERQFVTVERAPSSSLLPGSARYLRLDTPQRGDAPPVAHVLLHSAAESGVHRNGGAVCGVTWYEHTISANPLLSDCQMCRWREISWIDIFWKTLIKFTDCL